MDQPESDETAPFFPAPGIPDPITDNRSARQKRLAQYIILTSTFFERAAFYSLTVNLVSSLSSDELLKWTASHSSVASFIFSGTTYISALIFAVISDGYLGRAKTILFGFVFYLIGYILAILVTNRDVKLCVRTANSTDDASHASTLFDEPCAGWILATLIIIAIGGGAVQSNMAVFGAEQIQKSKRTSRYFDKYMVAVNMGGIAGALVISYLHLNTATFYIGYSIAASMLGVSILLFVIGWRYCIHAKPYDSVVALCIPFLITRVQSWRQTKRSRSSSSASVDLTDPVSSGRFTDRMVNDVKSLRRVVIAFSLLIPYFLIYHQINTTFTLQGEHMRKPSSVSNIGILMILADPVTIIVGIVLLNVFIYRHLDTRHSSSTMHRKFLLGMFFAMITMVIAGTVEKFRREQCNGQEIESSLPIYYLLFQNVCMGVSELFALVASYEYAYFAAPQSGQSLFMSLRFVSLGVASFIGSGLISVYPAPSFSLDFSCRIEERLNWCFYAYFYILAGVQFIFIILFHASQQIFDMIRMNPQQMGHYRYVSSDTAN